ncbi:hypothetical protein CU098_010135 [Rhizopus stolonifer]|uniref:Uncharacterized protein n=1 Tax=Rhizopus stolonifer TaxID=4846 RepID=A0A367JDW3_RHIST|nr:hypothetical protein CU098_010135 [Rhizopus stolonifer]
MSQSPTEKLLEHLIRSRGNSNICIPTKMEKEGNVPLPTLEANTQDITRNQEKEDKKSNPSHSLVANTTLISDVATTTIFITINDNETEQKLEASRLAIFRNKRKTLALPEI